MNLLLRYYSLKGIYLFIGILLANLLIVGLSKVVLINEIVFYNTYSEQLSYDRALRLFEDMNSLAWISYAFIPIMFLIKFSLVSLLLYVGVVFCNIQNRISLGTVFKTVIASEFVFVIGGMLKFLWFYLFAGNYDLNDLGFFYPFSLINFFKTDEVARVWIYPLQTINLFHFAYVFFISYGLYKVGEIGKADSEKVVLLSYLPGLFLWVVFVMFLTIDTVI